MPDERRIEIRGGAVTFKLLAGGSGAPLVYFHSYYERSAWSPFLRGLIESDGCRHRRIVGGRNYSAYSFTNHSEDILGLFVWACGLIGVRSRRSNRVMISIARRPDVARLDSLMAREAV